MKEIKNNERKSRLLILSTYLFEQYPRHVWEMHRYKNDEKNSNDLYEEIEWSGIYGSSIVFVTMLFGRFLSARDSK